ncbi:hypothetical protein FRACYDRAFT_162667, partial [Fragilariopsis cylindrus CCMP1102]
TNTKSKSNRAVWDNMYRLLVKYKKREGHCNVPNMYKEEKEKRNGVGGGENLGKWLVYQRRSKTKGTLDSYREEQLDKIGMVWDMKAQQWDDMFTLLVKYKEREGDCNVPVRYKEVDVDGRGEEETKNLGKWLIRQRYVKKMGKLDPFKEERLMDVGIVWDLFSHQWEDMFTMLVQYKQREGDCYVPI